MVRCVGNELIIIFRLFAFINDKSFKNRICKYFIDCTLYIVARAKRGIQVIIFFISA